MNVNISSISPMGYVLGMLIIIVGNYFFSFCKSKVIKRCYLVLSSLISITGILAVLILRPHLMQKINSPRVEIALVAGSIRRFEHFFRVSVIAISLIVIFLMCLLFFYKKNGNRTIMYLFSFTIIAAIIITFFAGLLCGIETMNKFIDVPSYVLAVTISEIAILHIPLAARRILLKKQDN